MHRSDPQLIRRCLDGCPDAWDELVERYARLVYSIPRRYRMSDADTEDVFQAVFLKIFQKLETLQDETKVSAWLITTTHRECWRIGRNSGRSPNIDQQIIDVGSPADDQLERWERQQVVREALRQLGGRCEKLLTALFLSPGEPSYEAIARDLDMKVGSIGPTRARCFGKLEKLLVEAGLEPAEPRR